MRNSSLVERCRAENPTGLKVVTETMDADALLEYLRGRGAFHAYLALCGENAVKVARKELLERMEVRMLA